MGTDTDEKRAALLRQIGVPLGRYGRPEDIAAAVVYPIPRGELGDRVVPLRDRRAVSRGYLPGSA